MKNGMSSGHELWTLSLMGIELLCTSLFSKTITAHSIFRRRCSTAAPLRCVIDAECAYSPCATMLFLSRYFLAATDFPALLRFMFCCDNLFCAHMQHAGLRKAMSVNCSSDDDSWFDRALKTVQLLFGLISWEFNRMRIVLNACCGGRSQIVSHLRHWCVWERGLNRSVPV